MRAIIPRVGRRLVDDLLGARENRPWSWARRIRARVAWWANGELAYRFGQLNPDAKAAAVRYERSKKGQKDLERLARVDQAKNKTSGGAPAKKKQAAGPRTLDDLLADIDGKLDLIQGVSRAGACQKMAETIAADTSLSEGDKKRLTELIGQLDGSR